MIRLLYVISVIVCHHASKKNAKVGYFFIMRLPAVIISRGMYVIN